MSFRLPADRFGDRAGERLPSPGLRSSLPLGVLCHVGVLWLIVESSLSFDASRLPPPAFHRVMLSAPPAAAVRSGDPKATPTPENLLLDVDAAHRREPRLSEMRSELLAMLDRTEVEAGVFGAEEGIPEGLWDGLPLGRAEGVRGGIPGGVPGGRIGGLGNAGADPWFPPPDEPPEPIRMPRPRFPREALRNGVRGRVVLRAVITARGTVEVVRLLRSVPALDTEAVRVVESEWRFRPARRNGRPVPALSDLVVRFTLR